VIDFLLVIFLIIIPFSWVLLPIYLMYKKKSKRVKLAKLLKAELKNLESKDK